MTSVCMSTTYPASKEFTIEMKKNNITVRQLVYKHKASAATILRDLKTGGGMELFV